MTAKLDIVKTNIIQSPYYTQMEILTLPDEIIDDTKTCWF